MQVVCLGTGSSLKLGLDPNVLPENQTTAGGLPGNWFKSKVLFSNWLKYKRITNLRIEPGSF